MKGGRMSLIPDKQKRGPKTSKYGKFTSAHLMSD